MATIKDVAHLAGVSVATVSRVINHSPKASDQAREAVLQAMDTLRYHPNANARALAQQHTRTLGLLVGDVADPFFGLTVRTTEQVASQAGHFLLTGNGYHNEQKETDALEQLIRHRCTAIVAHCKKIPDEPLSRFMQHIPGMVLINRMLPGFEHRCITLDNRYGSKLATEHLLQQGHQQTAYLCSDHDISDAHDRLQGYLDALLQAHIPINERLIAYGEPSEAGGEQTMMALLSRGEPFSAIACYNDAMAAGAMGILYDNNLRIPQQISLVGFDDILTARYMRPRLTTVHYPIIQMATQAAQLALALAENITLPAVTHVFQPTLVRRQSVQSVMSADNPDFFSHMGSPR